MLHRKHPKCELITNGVAWIRTTKFSIDKILNRFSSDRFGPESIWAVIYCMYKNLTNKAYLLLSVSSHPLALTSGLGTHYNTSLRNRNEIHSIKWTLTNQFIWWNSTWHLIDWVPIFNFEWKVVLSSDIVGVFCLPNSTESEKNFYVIRDQKALESVQNYRLVVTS